MPSSQESQEKRFIYKEPYEICSHFINKETDAESQLFLSRLKAITGEPQCRLRSRIPIRHKSTYMFGDIVHEGRGTGFRAESERLRLARSGEA